MLIFAVALPKAYVEQQGIDADVDRRYFKQIKTGIFILLFIRQVQGHFPCSVLITPRLHKVCPV